MMVLRTVKAYVDRIEQTQEGQRIAVVLVEDEELQLHVPIGGLGTPVKAGDWLRVELDESNKIMTLEVLKEETVLRRRQLQERWERMRKRKHSRRPRSM